MICSFFRLLLAALLIPSLLAFLWLSDCQAEGSKPAFKANGADVSSLGGVESALPETGPSAAGENASQGNGASAQSVPAENATTADTGLSDENMDFLNEENGGEPAKPALADPLEPLNRAVFIFNDKLYFWVLKPLAQGYGKVAPKPVRKGFSNFFNNLSFPVRFANCVLQGKGSAAEGEFARFFANSTIGCLGFIDLGEKYKALAPPDPEDTGQTLGRWGLGGGFYLVLPFFGPSSARDACGKAVDKLLLDPVSYVEPASASIGISGFDKLNGISLSIGDYETLKDAAFDPYTASRDAFIQYRKARVEK